MDSLHVNLERLALAAERQAHATERLAQILEQFISLPGLTTIAAGVGRLADHLAPCSSPIVGTPSVAERLGCTTVWVAELVRTGQIPKHCLVPGTGKGKLWKFYREKIDRWLESR
jgi:hypothetical protein